MCLNSLSRKGCWWGPGRLFLQHQTLTSGIWQPLELCWCILYSYIYIWINVTHANTYILIDRHESWNIDLDVIKLNIPITQTLAQNLKRVEGWFQRRCLVTIETYSQRKWIFTITVSYSAAQYSYSFAASSRVFVSRKKIKDYCMKNVSEIWSAASAVTHHWLLSTSKSSLDIKPTVDFCGLYFVHFRVYYKSAIRIFNWWVLNLFLWEKDWILFSPTMPWRLNKQQL